MEYYRNLLRNRERIEVFRTAIDRDVGPGDRVLEIGTGLGTYAMFAADAGADMVWAIDGEAVVHVAATVAKMNGYGERIQFIRGWVPEVELDARANVLIFEDFSINFMDVETHQMLTRVSRDYLTPDARAIPAGARISCAPVHSPTSYAVCSDLDRTSDVAFGIDWSATKTYVCNQPLSCVIDDSALLAVPQVLSTVTLLPAPSAADLGGSLSFVTDRAGEMHGVAIWFELVLGKGLVYSNGPGAGDSPWGQMLLPLEDALALDAGTEVHVEIGYESAESGAPGLTWWTVSVDGTRQGGHEFRGFPASLKDLQVMEDEEIPTLGRDGQITRRILDLVDGTATCKGIRSVLIDEFGLDPETAAGFVDSVLSEHAR
ncbi:MAG: hypothetical protein ACE5FJ_11385 [Gemmatimonadales bacterium]